MKIIVRIAVLFGFVMVSMAQEQQQDTIAVKKVVLDEVFVSAIRVTNQTPVTFSNLTKEEIKSRNLGQDIPILLNFLPSVVTTSDAGAGVGYTGIRVRGSDATRVNVTINGIPYNDAESHGTFWVNMPDFASSTQSLQLQRGVGTSTNGAGAFGASLNILTDAISEDVFGEVSSSFGSFNTLKNTLKFSTGLLNDHVEIAGRLSKITSDGYIDRASSKLDSYFLQASYKDENTLLKALLFGGQEVTYQSWYGFNAVDVNAIGEDGNIMSNRRFNIAGARFDNDGNSEGFYENQVDDYKQNHAQLLWNETITSNWSSNLAFHFTRGKGFFEEYVDEWLYTNVYFRDDAKLEFIGRDNFTLNGEEISATDYIRRRWLDNKFYGTVFSANYVDDALNFIVGGGYNKYEGGHFGEVIWTQFNNAAGIRDRYYDDSSTKTDFNLYTKANYNLSNKWRIYADLQYRRVTYAANGNDTGLVDDNFNFYNPKAGINYKLNNANNLYFSFALANREPNRNDYENGNPKPERLNDFELGWRYVTSDIQVNTNAYYMKYNNQLVLTGALNDVGAPLRENIGDSYRLGFEIDASMSLGSQFRWNPNIALSINKNKDFNFQRDGVLQNLGDTNIAFSPNVVISNQVSYRPSEQLQFSLLNKYVGKQYMGNIDAESSVLEAYSQSDFNIQYVINCDSFIKNITLSGLVNNIFDQKNITNGYFFTFDDNFSNPGVITTVEGAGYYPQAGVNFLIGATVHF